MADVPETRASQALKAKVEKDGQKTVCEKTGLAQPTLSQLVNLKRQPGRKVARQLEKIGIRQPWWDQPPVEAESNETGNAPTAAE